MAFFTRKKLSKLFVISVSTLTIISYQNCGKSFQTSQKLSDVVDQASSLDNLPPVSKGEIDLVWDRTTMNEDNSAASIRGYKIYIGTSAGNYNKTISESVVGNFIDHRVSNLNSGVTYYFAVAAVSNDGIESNKSSEISYTMP